MYVATMKNKNNRWIYSEDVSAGARSIIFFGLRKINFEECNWM
jgi:hypothetical protein